MTDPISAKLKLLVVLGAATASTLLSCAGVDPWDCVETPGYCPHSEICDSITRHCERKCTEHPPRICPEGSSCDYGSGACRVACKSDGRLTETICEDGSDDDCDGFTDCADSDCDLKGCGNGCVCGGGTRREVICNDGIDNNADGLIDCADPNCAGVACRKPTSLFGHPEIGACDVEEVCQGGSDLCPDNAFAAAGTLCRPAAEVCDAEERCTGLTADCPADGFAGSGKVCRASTGPCDIADVCAGDSLACTADGKLADGAACGSGCACQAGVAREKDCADLVDNDADGAVDCADVTDCPPTTVCKMANGQPGTCKGDLTCG